MVKSALLFFFVLVLLVLRWISVPAQGNDSTDKKIAAYIEKMIRKANIPGLSVVLIDHGKLKIASYGYANREAKEKVNSKTLFQLASCSKAFTALAIRMLENEGKLNLSAAVTDYIPWFKMRYKGRPAPITLYQLLHHTSGIPWNSMIVIPSSDAKDALEQTIRNLTSLELTELPGKKYGYATINYDVLALVIEKVTGQSFESYIQGHVFSKLVLPYTSVEFPIDSGLMATGYKIGFLKPRKYEAPLYKANNAAGYIISNAEDMAKWLQVQMGLLDSGVDELVKKTSQRDETVSPSYDMFSYAEGWMVSLRGDGEIYHSGLNPNFTCYVGFRPKPQIGVVVLANSNSSYTEIMGRNLLKLLAGQEVEKDFSTFDGYDKSYTIVSGILAVYILIVLGYLGIIIREILKRRRKYEGLSRAKLKKFSLSLVMAIPFFYGMYILPGAVIGLTWESTLVWSPLSFAVMIMLILAAWGSSYIVYFLSLIYPEKNKFKRLAPVLLLMSILSGIANMIVILLITSALNTDVKLKYLLFYYVLTLSVYLFTRWFVQINLVKISNELIYELRVKILDKIFSTSYQKFEQIPGGRVYAALNDDVQTMGESANMFVMLIINLFTIIGAFLYLSSIAFWATLLTVMLVLALTTIYYVVSRNANRFFEEARDTREIFINFINGMIEGFKEISLHRKKRMKYKEDISASANEYKTKITEASNRFINASVIGESVLILILGIVAFALQRIFTEIRTSTIISFIVVLLYLIGPLNAVLNSIPSILRIKIAWNRVQQFLREIPANMDDEGPQSVSRILKVNSIKAEGLKFKYNKTEEETSFMVGPIDLEIKKGEIVFIIGGNGSGKTTLSKLLTGLYKPDQGKLLLNGEVVESSQIGEYFSAIFSPVYLFQKLYNIDVKNNLEKVKKFLRVLHLENKVTIQENKYSTINLSSGQRKRLALLQCYLEDAPIFLFDEWAADQDPEYRHFFYRTLLPEMKQQGKIVIAITHDDHYFDAADAVVKMENGQLEVYSNNYQESYNVN